MTRTGDRFTAGGTLEQVSTKRWRIIGPSLLVVATWIGTGGLVTTLVATLVAGSLHGYTLLRAAAIGCVIKIFLVEGADLFLLSTDKTTFQGWKSLGPWTTWYFGPTS